MLASITYSCPSHGKHRKQNKSQGLAQWVRSKKGKGSEAWKGLAEGDFGLGLGVVQAQKSLLGAIQPAGLAIKEWVFARAQITIP